MSKETQVKPAEKEKNCSSPNTDFVETKQYGVMGYALFSALNEAKRNQQKNNSLKK